MFKNSSTKPSILVGAPNTSELKLVAKADWCVDDGSSWTFMCGVPVFTAGHEDDTVFDAVEHGGLVLTRMEPFSEVWNIKIVFYKNRRTHFWICFCAYKSNGGFDSQQYYLPFTGDRNSSSPANNI